MTINRLALICLSAVALGHANSCITDLGCSLNGDCDLNSATCSCYRGWRGPACDELDIKPTSRDAGYHNSSYASWGGNVVHADGKYHLFVAQFVNHCPLGQWGTASSIVRAEADSPMGPFVYKETVVPAFSHNPTVRQGLDGYYYIWMIGDGGSETPPNCTNSSSSPSLPTSPLPTASATAPPGSIATAIHVTRSESVYGPWSSVEMITFDEILGTSDSLCQGHTNPSPHFMPDGSVYLAFQAGPCDTNHGQAFVGLARAEAYNEAYVLVTDDALTPVGWLPDHPVCWAGVDEDPFLWIDRSGFHVLTHGMCPSGLRQAHLKFSPDGINWTTSPRQTYHYTVEYDDGSVPHVFARVERPQLWFEGGYDPVTGLAGAPKVLFNGVCGVGGGGSDYECIFDQLTGMTWTLARPLS